MSPRKTKIAKEILDEVYKTAMSSPSPMKMSPTKKRSQAKQKVQEFITDGCKFKMGPQYSVLARRAQRGMSTQHVREWCQGQTPK